MRASSGLLQTLQKRFRDLVHASSAERSLWTAKSEAQVSGCVYPYVTPGPLTSPELAQCIGVLGKGIDIAKDILIDGCSSVDESLR